MWRGQIKGLHDGIGAEPRGKTAVEFVTRKDLEEKRRDGRWDEKTASVVVRDRVEWNQIARALSTL